MSRWLHIGRQGCIVVNMNSELRRMLYPNARQILIESDNAGISRILIELSIDPPAPSVHPVQLITLDFRDNSYSEEAGIGIDEALRVERVPTAETFR